MRASTALLILLLAAPASAQTQLPTYEGRCTVGTYVTGYYDLLSTRGSTLATITGPGSTSNTDQTLNWVTYDTPPTLPAQTEIDLLAYVHVADNAVYDQNTFDYLGVYSDTLRGSLSVYKRTSGGTESLVCTVSMDAAINGTGYAMQTATCTLASEVAMASGDRLVVRHFHDNYYNSGTFTRSQYHQRSTCDDPTGRNYLIITLPAAGVAQPVVGFW